jgi:hypothetical protein
MPHATGKNTLLLFKYLNSSWEQETAILISLMSNTNFSAKVWRREDQLWHIGIDGSIILKCSLNKYDVCELDSAGLECGPVRDFCEYGKEPSRVWKGWESVLG